MNITLDNPTILGITNNYSFSPGGIALRQVQNISIEGLLLSLGSTVGIGGIWPQVGGKTTDGLISITINNVTYTDAKLNSFDYKQSENQDVKTKPVQIEFEVYSEFGSSNDKDYLNNYIFEDIESISDTFSLNKSEGNRKEYAHSFNVQYFNKIENDLLNASRTIAEGILITNKYALSMLGGGYTNNHQRYYTETFDVLKGSYSLNETLNYLDDITGGATKSIGHSLELGDGGIITVTEDAEIQGIDDVKYDKALVLFNTTYGGAYSRCANFLNTLDLEAEPDILNTLLTTPISKSTIKDEFLGKINYTVQFTNQKKFDPTKTVIQEVSIDFNKSEEGFVEFVENGSYTAYGKTSSLSPSANAKFKSAFDKYKTDYSSSYSTAKSPNNLAQGLLAFGKSPTKYALINTNINCAVTDGKVTFNHTYSNKEIYNSPSPYKYVSVQQSEEDALASTQIFQVPGFGSAGGAELVQYLKRSSPIKRSVSVDIKGKRDTKFETYIGKFKTYIPTLSKPNFLISQTFSFNPVKNSFNGTAEWIFFDKRNRARNDFTINKAQDF